MAKKDEAKMIQARFLKKGDIVKLKTGEEVIRSVSVIVQWSNGANEELSPHQEVELVPDEEVPGRDQ